MQITIQTKNNNVFYKIPFVQLEEYRLKNFLSPTEFAKKIGIPLRSYYHLKKNKNIHVKTALKLNKFFKTMEIKND
tara:strand:- start:96 stop:323 length:228 start_codon:yes stop_codon:yes gene_type:complete